MKLTKRIGSFLLSLAMALTLAAPVLPTASAAASTGTTYYVSARHGSDSFDGRSEATPWYSLDKINALDLGPGDKVLLERGSVFENQYLHIKGSGADGAPITIDAYGQGDKPRIDTNGNGIWYQNYGQPLDSDSHVWRGYVSSCILLYDVEYIEIKNLAMTNWGGVEDGATVTGEQKIVLNSDVPGSYNWKSKMNRTGVAVVTQDIGTADHIYLQGLDVKNIYGNVYDKHMNNGGIYFTVALPHDQATTGIARFNDVLIEGNRVERTSRWGIAAAYTAYWKEFKAMAIDDATCKRYGTTGLVIRNNYVKDTGGDPITTMYAFQPLIEHNVAVGGAREMTNAIYNATSSGRVAAGIWPWKCKTALFQYNECYDMTANPGNHEDSQAWDADWGDSTIYQYNYSHNNDGGCIMTCDAQAYNTVFRYNISYKDGSPSRGVLNTCNAPNGKFYNNTYIVAENVPIIRSGMAGGNPVHENNIFCYLGSTPRTENWYLETPNAVYDNNLYVNYQNVPTNDKNAKTATIADVFGSVDFSAAPTAPTATGVVHSWETDFDMFRLAENSPAINAGKTISLTNGLGSDHGVTPVTKDFYGNALDASPDIGAHDTRTVALVLTSDAYTVDQAAKTISDIPVNTTVEDFLPALRVDEGVAVTVKRGDSAISGATLVLAGDRIELSYQGSTQTYTVVASNDHELKACIYEIKDSTINVPFPENNPVSVHEFLNGITTAATAMGKVYDGGTEVVDGNVKDGMTFQVIAQDGSAGTVYTIQNKLIYNHSTDWPGRQQGNLWFAQNKEDGNYTDLTQWDTEWLCWQADGYVSVEHYSIAGDVRAARPTESTSMAFRAPTSGIIQISFDPKYPVQFRVAGSNKNSGTIHLLITKNGITLDGHDHELPKNVEDESKIIPITIEPFEIYVNKGDWVRFEAKNSGDVPAAGFQMVPVITYLDKAYVDDAAPTPPTGLSALDVAENSATLTWTASTDNVGVVGYKVYNGSTLVTSLTGTSYTVTGLSAGTSYTFRVTAVDAAGNESTPPAEVTFTTQVQEYISRPSGNTSHTVKNEDGSTTKTVTDKKTGVITATTTYPDGTKIVTTTPKDGEAVSVVTVPKDKDSATVTIPTDQKPAPGKVAVIVNADGTMETVRTSVATDNGMRITLSGDATIKIIDNSKTFSDVAASHWAADAIQFAASRELFTGTGGDSFNPTGDMTRSMLVTVLARLDGQDTEGGETWYSKAMNWGMETGVTDGANMDASITRESLVVMLYRYAKAESPEDTALSGFPDADKVSGWAEEAMGWAVQNGILTGTGAGALNPAGTASRAEVATIIMRFAAL